MLPGRGTPAKPFASNALNQALKVSLQGQQIPAFTIHDLRRTASTLLHEQGWPSDVVEKALNHTIGGVRGVYKQGGIRRAAAGDAAGVVGLHRWAGAIGQFGGVSPAGALVAFSLFG